jgi:hypothetical protein
MAAFAQARSGVNFPTFYRDAVRGLRLRVFDQTENEVPEWVESVEVGDGLRAVVTLGAGVVSVDVSRMWGVSMDELVATATRNVNGLRFERKELGDIALAPVVATVGHPWVSSLITSVDEESKGPEGTIVAIPRADVMLTAPVTGAATVDSLEMMMLLCDELYDPTDGGVSPHVWWSWADGLHRITDRLHDGEVDIQPALNVAAFYFARALVHLANPCQECDRTGPA